VKNLRKTFANFVKMTVNLFTGLLLLAYSVCLEV